MPEIQITVTDKVAQVSGSPVIVCGNSDYAVTFTFDSEWNAYTAKTARFAYYKNGIFMYEDVLFEGSSVSIPVLHDIDEVAIGVYAGDLHTTTPARVPCQRSITDGAAIHSDPQPDIYAQLLEYLAGLQGGGGAAGATAFDFRNMRLPDYTTGTVIASAGASGGAAGVTTEVEGE